MEVSKFIDEETQLLENSGCISKSVNQWAAPVIVVPKKPDPLHLNQQQLCSVLNY